MHVHLNQNKNVNKDSENSSKNVKTDSDTTNINLSENYREILKESRIKVSNISPRRSERVINAILKHFKFKL